MKYCLCVLFTLLHLHLSATSITGYVTTDKQQPVAAANVFLLSTDSQFVKAAITNDSGYFQLEDVVIGSYIIKATAVGYSSFVKAITFSGGDMNVETIILYVTSNLEQVTIRGIKPFIEMKDGKLIVNVENSIVSTGSSVLDALARAPGVKVTQDDNILLKGRPSVRILMDEKTIPLSGADLANMLKGMPSSRIEKIEIINNPSSRYDAAGNAGIINIITKRDKRMGTNATLNAAYGQGIYPKANSSAHINYRSPKLNLYTNLSYSYRKGINYQILHRDFYENNIRVLTYNQEDNAVLPVKSIRGAAGADYNITHKTTVGIAGSGGANLYNPFGSNYSASVNPDGTLQSYFTTINQATDKWYDYAVNASLHHSFDTSGKTMNIDADYARYASNTHQDFYVNYFTPSGTPYLPAYLLHGDLTGQTQIRSVKADIVLPYKNNLRIEAGAKSSYVTADNEPLFYDRSNGGNIYDTTRSNHFIYEEQINAAYASATKEWKKWSGQIGLRIEHTLAKGNQLTTGNSFNRNYAQLFPSLFVQRHLNANNDLGITLSRRIERPAYKQLNPFKYFVDPTEYDEGNPYLQPALSYAAELSHTFKQQFITTFSYSITNNVITEVVKTDQYNDKINAQIEVNLERLAWYNLSCAYPFAITKWWNNVVNTNIYYTHYYGAFAGTGLDRAKPSLDLNMTNSFVLPKSFSAEVSFFYQTPQVYAFMDMGQYWSLNCGVQKNLLDKKLTIKTAATDIFWQSSITGTSRYINYVQSFLNRRDARVVTLSVTWRPGKRSVQAVQQKSGGAADEKKRAGS